MTDKKLECFVISPIGAPGSSIRKEADWVLRKLIHPALTDSYTITRADEFTKGDIITNRVISSIQSADLVVAVMAGHNPNVFYELALAHAYSRPVIPLIKAGELIPFDVGFVGTIFYSHDDVSVWDSAIDEVKAAAVATRVAGYRVSSPITMALGTAKASASADSPEAIVSELAAEVAELRAEVSRLRPVSASDYHNISRLFAAADAERSVVKWFSRAAEEEHEIAKAEALTESFANYVKDRQRVLGRKLTESELATAKQGFHGLPQR